MPNSKAKDRKRFKHKLNINLNKYGRTRRQNKKYMMKSALNDYHVEFEGTLDERYEKMNKDIARVNRINKLKEEEKTHG